MTFPLKQPWRGLIFLFLSAAPVPLLAQAQGTFIVPSNRAGHGTRFSYWQAYAPAGQTTSGQAHLPNLLPDQGDSADPVNYSNWNAGMRLFQTGTPTAFVLGAGHGIYSFAGVAAFRINYTHSGPDDVKGVILQFKMAGVVPLESVTLKYTPEGGSAEIVLPPDFRALDNPGTAGFAEQLLWAYEWDLSGKGVKDYSLYFSTAGTSSPLYQVQTDTTVTPEFHQELGFILTGRALPALRYGAPGKSVPDLSVVEETRFFKGGQTFPLLPEPEDGFEHAGWVDPEGRVVDSTEPLAVTFSETDPSDLTVSTVFSPASWETFRDTYFNHEFTHGGQTSPDDSMDDAKSGPDVDLDGDGASNFHEYAFGGLPYVPDGDRMRPVPGLVPVVGILYPSITYRRRAATAGDLKYVVEVSADLKSWARTGSGQAILSETDGPLEPDGTRTVTARSLVPASAGPQFLRVKAESQP